VVRKARIIVEVELGETETLGVKPSPQSALREIERGIHESCGYYPNFNYNTMKIFLDN
jgi:hypothetical protein